MIVFDIPAWQIFTLLAGIILPLAVGLVTTKVTNAGRKAVILAALAVGISLATELAAALQQGETYNLGLALLTGVGTFLVAVGTHYGFWKPTGVTDKAQSTLRSEEPKGLTIAPLREERLTEEEIALRNRAAIRAELQYLENGGFSEAGRVSMTTPTPVTNDTGGPEPVMTESQWRGDEEPPRHRAGD